MSTAPASAALGRSRFRNGIFRSEMSTYVSAKIAIAAMVTASSARLRGEHEQRVAVGERRRRVLDEAVAAQADAAVRQDRRQRGAERGGRRERLAHRGRVDEELRA